MADRPACQESESSSRKRFNEQFALMEATMVPDIPELMNAWADEEDPRLAAEHGASTGAPTNHRRAGAEAIRD